MVGLQQDSVYGLCDYLIHPHFYPIYRRVHHVSYILFVFSLDKSNFCRLPAARGCFPEMEGTRWWECDTSEAQSQPPSLLPLAKAMSNFPDYYAVLGVSKAATTEEIRTAYKKESLRYAATSLFVPLIVWYLILAVDQDSP